jgi:hypothetical protein
MSGLNGVATKKLVKIETVDFPIDWSVKKVIRTYAIAKSFPHYSKIPDDVNPRKANTKQPVYQAMINTLLTEPGIFHERNVGVYLFAAVEKVDVLDNGRQIISLAFLPAPSAEFLPHGHSDGRHTMMSLYDKQVRDSKIDLDKVLVPITLELRFPTQKDKQKACDRQTTYAYDPKTKHDAAGDFAKVKKLFPSEWKICYHQNQTDTNKDPRCSISHFLQIGGMFDHKFDTNNPKEGQRFPKGYITNIGVNYKKLINHLLSISDLIPDISLLEYWFWETAKKDYQNSKSRVPTFHYGENKAGVPYTIWHPCREYIVPGIDAPRSSILPIISSFKLLTVYNEKTKSCYWKIPFSKEIYQPLIQKLWFVHKEWLYVKQDMMNAKNPLQSLLKDNSYWHELHATSNKYANLKQALINSDQKSNSKKQLELSFQDK